MGITMVTLGRMMAPLQAMFSLRRVGNPLPSARALPGGQRGCPPCRVPAEMRRRPLRVVHSTAGRLVISGRMADVCAELDRLAALEASTH
jgi:hypothetical protein